MSQFLKSPQGANAIKEWLQKISFRAFNPVLYVDGTDVGNSAGAQTDLHSYTVPNVPGTHFWRGIGQHVRVTSYGSFASNGNTKTLEFYCGSSSLFSFSQAINGGTYKFVAEINRIDTSTIEVFGTLLTSNATYPVYVSRLGVAAAGVRLTPGTFKTTGDGAGANDIQESYFRVESFLSGEAY